MQLILDIDERTWAKIQQMTQAFNFSGPEVTINEALRLLYLNPGRKVVDEAAGRVTLDFSSRQS